MLTTDVGPPRTEAQSDSIVRNDTRRLQIGCWIALIAIAAVSAWFTRYELEPDSMSYLDVVRAVVTGHPGAAIHAYWSPGYPLLVSFFFWAFRPNVHWEFPLVHFVNLLIFAATLACFQMFWGEALQWHRKSTETCNSEVPDSAFWALGYAAYGIATLNVITVGLVGPDLLVAAACCLAGWSALRFRRSPSVGPSVLLGLVLALGYYVKAPFFPMGLVFLVCACLRRPIPRRTIFLAGTALATFLLLCAPFITALSSARGRLTFGDSARLNQAFYVNGVQFFRHWQGGPPGSGTPIHPTRKLNEFPEIYEFAASDMGTYPPWFDPTYWNAGIMPHLNVKRQAVLFVRNLALVCQIILESGAQLVCVLIILALLCGYRRQWIEGLLRLWFIWVPGAMALAMFALVHVEPRFLGGWLILLFAGGISACSLPPDHGTRRAVWCIGAAALITTGAALILQTSREAIGIDHADGRSSQDVSIAVGLLNSGLRPGDGIALIGDGTGAYWAYLARLHIVAEIPAGSASRPSHPALDFWQSEPELQQKALKILEGTGAKAVIAGANPSIVASVPSLVPGPWKRVDGTHAFVYFFPANHSW
jgi:hypothetical protein